MTRSALAASIAYLALISRCLAATVEVASPSAPIDFAAGKLKAALEQAGEPAGRIIVRVEKRPDLPAGSFDIWRNVDNSISVIAVDPAGAMHGTLELAERIRIGTQLNQIKDATVRPRFPFRAIKFNLPWMSYRKHEALTLHDNTCRDLEFWQAFLDMMAENRFNTLTLWSLHPFTWMIRPKNFPEACGFDDRELAEWQSFWKTLFRMARDRGIEVYLVNWNIFVSPEFAKAHNLAKYSVDWSYFGDGDQSELVARYNREVVTQVIDEYEDLAGIGISLGERMGGMTPQQREDWVLRTVVAGMKQAKRPVKFIHRAPFSANLGSGGSMDATTESIARRTIESLDLPKPIWVEVKFNWSHGHSSPNLNIIHGGRHSDTYWSPPPKDYKLAWMIRNEDFFMLRWGEPDFIRQHIRNNDQEYVGGYFVGSECYIPARDYFSKPDPRITWKYAFQRQWLYYMLWGRLLFDPNTPNAVFEAEFDRRFGRGSGTMLLEAYTLTSRMPLRLASFHGATWDFTLYSEGFCAPAQSNGLFDKASPFISIDELIDHRPLDPSYISIPDYVRGNLAGNALAASRIAPPALADALQRDGERAMRLIAELPHDEKLEFECADIRAWAHLSLYFAQKLRGGVALESFRQRGDEKHRQEAVARLEAAAKQWDELVGVTEPIYREAPLVHMGDQKFHWANFREQVRRDIELAKKAEPRRSRDR